MPMKMKIETIPLGVYQTNCYILKSEAEDECLIIDPGEESPELIKLISSSKVRYIINTHRHPDHIGGNGFIKRRFGAKLLFHRAEQQIFNFCQEEDIEADDFLAEGDIIQIGEVKLKVLHTPGHSPGSITLLTEQSLFSGDLLFAGSIGRTDLPGGSDEGMWSSLRRIMELEGDFLIYPGHGPATTLAAERRYNPFLIELKGLKGWGSVF